MMTNILLPLLFTYFIWYLIKPGKSVLKTPLFGNSLDYYIFKECKPDENFRMDKYEKWELQENLKGFYGKEDCLRFGVQNRVRISEATKQL